MYQISLMSLAQEDNSIKNASDFGDVVYILLFDKSSAS